MPITVLTETYLLHYICIKETTLHKCHIRTCLLCYYYMRWLY